MVIRETTAAPSSTKKCIDSILKRDIYVQYLCDVSLKEAQTFINSSTLTKFRKQIGIEGIRIIEQEIFASLKRAKLFKGKRLITDTTVVPSPIAYPTDISLLEKTRQRAVKYIKKAKEFGAKTYRTYKRIAGKTYIQYQKIRHHTVKSRKKTQKKLHQFTSRNIKQLKDALENIGNSTADGMHKIKAQFLKEAEQFLDIASNVIEQQKDIYKGLPVKERIVSIFKPHIRPMVRGKYPNKVEFGPKILLNLKNDLLFLEDLRFNNVSDEQLLVPSIKGYQERFGHLATQLTADRGFWSPKNYKLAQDYGINKIAIENKGKSSHLSSKPFAKRLRRLRCRIEAKISLSKRKFGLDRIRYTMESGEEMWIRLGLICMNLKAAVDYG
jgi:IS5 family transposase